MHLCRFQSHLAASRVVGLRLDEGDKEKAHLQELYGHLYFLSFQLQVANPTLSLPILP